MSKPTAAQDARFIALTGTCSAVARTPLYSGLELLLGRHDSGDIATVEIVTPGGEPIPTSQHLDVLDTAHRHALHLAQRAAEAASAHEQLHAGRAPSNSANGATLSPTPTMIGTVSGGFIDVSNPDPSSVHLRDIAQGLALTCRYGGQIDRFYSVAEHAVLVHDLLAHQGAATELLLAGLFHDAAEGYLGDVVAPLKFGMRRGAGTSVYDEFSAKMDTAIAERYEVSLEHMESKALRVADMWALRIEASALTPTGGSHWHWDGELPNGGTLPAGVIWPAGLDWERARDLWLGTVSLYLRKDSGLAA